jgi:hypothetical protein
MDFEEMKKIWDTQNDAPLYAVDESALRRGVRRKARQFKQFIVFFEAVVMVMMLGLAVFYVASSFSRGQHDRLVSGAILLGTAANFVLQIRRRRRGEARFDVSLLGDIDKSLWQVRNHISRARGLRSSLIAPMCLAVVIDWVFPVSGFQWSWLFPLFLALMALSAWGIEYEVRCWYLPKTRNLEALRKILVET